MHPKFVPIVLLAMAVLTGCSNAGGRAGDANDPAATTDSEQMSKETGDVGGVNGKKPKERLGAEGV